MFGNLDVAKNPCGQISGSKIFNTDWKKTEADYFDKRHKSHFRTGEGIPSEFKRYFKQHHTDVTTSMNNLQNFNPTNKGITYFEQHDTNKHINYPTSRPRFESFNYRDTSIPDKIDALKKEGNHLHTYFKHAPALKVRRL